MAKSGVKRPAKGGARKPAEGYTHPDQTLLMRPEVGTQAQFRKKRPPVTYRYDSSLSPALDWDGGNGARELGEWLLRVIAQAAVLPAPHTLAAPAEFKRSDGTVAVTVRSLQDAIDQLKRLSGPFLNWTGKAERLSFDVPTLPLFVHERLSTKAIVETLVGHRTDKQADFWELLGDPRHSITDQVLKAYEYPDKWVNRLILGDSLSFKKTSGLGATLLQGTQDFILWYGRDKTRIKFRRVYTDKREAAEEDSHYTTDTDGGLYTLSDLTAQNNDVQSCLYDYEFEGEIFRLPPGRQWKTTKPGMDRLVAVDRVIKAGKSIRYKRFVLDFPLSAVTDTWHDIGGSVQSRSDSKVYVVQTGTGVVQRCVLMTTDPGDLVLDPTCGSGTTAYVAEQWGRRWITIDTSRVPVALARQRVLTATFPYYELREPARGPSGGFVYERKRNNKGEEVGGLVPHITLENFTTDEPIQERIVLNRAEVDNKIVRVTGPFAVEATIPTPVDWEGDGVEDSGAESVQSYGSFVERMIEVLRRSPVLHVGGGRTVELGSIRPPAKSLSFSAEGVALNGQPGTVELGEAPRPVAFVFGPENGAISEKLVHAALQEAQLKSYTHLYVIGFAIQPHARQLIDKSAEMGLVPATYVQATPDLMMGDGPGTTSWREKSMRFAEQ